MTRGTLEEAKLCIVRERVARDLMERFELDASVSYWFLVQSPAQALGDMARELGLAPEWDPGIKIENRDDERWKADAVFKAAWEEAG
jgi:hypothetical protein